MTATSAQDANVCRDCRFRNRSSAVFCRACGSRLRGLEVPVRQETNRRQQQGRARVIAMTVQCDVCRGANRDGAVFCRHCGHSLLPQTETHAGSDAAVRARTITAEPGVRTDLTPAEQPLPLLGDIPASTWGLRGLYAGGMLVMLGSFLPLASSAVSGGISLIPDLSRDTGSAYVVPLTAIILVILAAFIPRAVPRISGMLAGTCIALASPGLLLTWVSTSVGQSLCDTFIGQLAQGSVAVGAYALLLGFLSALIGGFVVLWHVHNDPDKGDQPS